MCEHLKPIADALAVAKIRLVRVSPYDEDNTWWSCACVFDEKPLRARLSIDASVTYYEYDGRVGRQRRHVHLQGSQDGDHGPAPKLRAEGA